MKDVFVQGLAVAMLALAGCKKAPPTTVVTPTPTPAPTPAVMAQDLPYRPPTGNPLPTPYSPTPDPTGKTTEQLKVEQLFREAN